MSSMPDTDAEHEAAADQQAAPVERTARSGVSLRTSAGEVVDRVGDGHVRALAGRAVLDLEQTPSARPRPTMTMVGTPISSASLNFTPGLTLRSS